MNGFIAVREFNQPTFLTKRDGWTTNINNAVVFPTIEAAEEKLRGRPALIKPVADYAPPLSL